MNEAFEIGGRLILSLRGLAAPEHRAIVDALDPCHPETAIACVQFSSDKCGGDGGHRDKTVAAGSEPEGRASPRRPRQRSVVP